MLLSTDELALARAAAAIGQRAPELAPELLDPVEARRREPALADGLAGCLLDTGYPVVPHAATMAFARQAQGAGARISTNVEAEPVIEAGRASAVQLASGERISCGQVLVAAGPWTPHAVPGWRVNPPIRRVWGVVVSVALESPPLTILEELGIDEPGAIVPSLFSLMTVGDTSSVGSTFLDDEPDTAAVAPIVVERAAEFVPAVRHARQRGIRACARPVSFDGRPLVGPIPDVEGLFVCAGHGPWGISCGVATAAIVTRQMLGMADDDSRAPNGPPMSELDPSRFRPDLVREIGV